MKTIAVADDHALFRKMLIQLIELSSDWKVIMEAQNGEELLHQLNTTDTYPDIILMDILMPVMDGKEATSFIQIHYPEIKIIALSALMHDHVILDMLRRGASGFITKQIEPEKLIIAIDTVMNKGIYIEEGLCENYSFINHPKFEKPILSDKQITFLKLCTSDKPYKEIADIMNISPNTADSYREELFRKLNIKTRQGLAIYAFKAGLSVL
ncbi:response regulator [Chitinophagaceae bacterium LWZ2-11]